MDPDLTEFSHISASKHTIFGVGKVVQIQVRGVFRVELPTRALHTAIKRDNS